MPSTSILSESCARIVAQFLVDEGVGGFRTNVTRTEPDWLIAVGVNPDEPADMIAVTDGPVWKDDGRLLATGEHIVHPGVQIRARSESRDTAYQKLTVVKELLQSVSREQVMIGEKEFRLDNVSPVSHVMYIGNDPGTDRPTFVFNTYVTAKEIIDG